MSKKKKLSLEQRRELVEVLRCAADHVLRGRTAGSALNDVTASLIEKKTPTDDDVFQSAFDAEQTVIVEVGSGWGVPYGENRYLYLLEAAARVESGLCP